MSSKRRNLVLDLYLLGGFFAAMPTQLVKLPCVSLDNDEVINEPSGTVALEAPMTFITWLTTQIVIRARHAIAKNS